jgi:hypothetical protein
MIITLLICFVWASICLCFDAFITNKGLRAGIAYEGNSVIVFFFGNKPWLWQLFAVDGTLRVALLGVGFIPGPEAAPHAFAALMIGGLIVSGFKNIQGYRQWKWMFSHPGQKLPLMDSAWAQFVGFWG